MKKLKKIVKSDAFKIGTLVIMCSLFLAYFGIICGDILHSKFEINQMDKELQESSKRMEEDARKMSEERNAAQELIDSGEAIIYMEGEPVSDKFEINGIDINRYRVKVKGKKVYISR